MVMYSRCFLCCAGKTPTATSTARRLHARPELVASLHTQLTSSARLAPAQASPASTETHHRQAVRVLLELPVEALLRRLQVGRQPRVQHRQRSAVVLRGVGCGL